MNPISSAQDMSNKLADSASASADSAIRSTQRLANQALDGVAGTVSDLRAEAAPMIQAAGDRVSALAQRSVESVRQGSQQLVDSAHHASARTREYVQDQPVKSLLMAAATGAALMALLSMMQRGRSQN